MTQHTPEIQNLINTALHAPATGSIVIQGAVFLDIISRMENAEQKLGELLNDMERIANPVKFFHIEHPEAAQKMSAIDIIFRFAGAGYAVDIANKAIAKAGGEV